MFRKIISVLLVLVIVLTGTVVSSDTIHIDMEETDIISLQEVNILTIAMKNRGMEGSIISEALYDAANQPSYLLGVSDAGYLIMSRGSLRCLESGEGNPYSNYQNEKKYYGGALCYYVQVGDAYYDIGRDTTVGSVIPITNLDDTINGTMSIGNETYVASTSATATITSTVILPHAEMWIRRKAFGYNDDNTCSAVACTIALDYMDYDNSNLVPSEYQLNYLTFSSGSDVEEKAPKSHAFHRFLADDCGMGIASFANAIVNGIKRYCNSSEYIGGTGLKCEYEMRDELSYATNEIDDNRPAMLTSFLADEYSWHTMVIYGYREYSDGSVEWLVHPGWYSKVEYYNNSYYRIKEVWVPSSTATYLYRFSYNPLSYTPSATQ